MDKGGCNASEAAGLKKSEWIRKWERGEREKQTTGFKNKLRKRAR